MNLYLLRHGPAADRAAFAGDDSDRPLTPEGRKRVHQVARALAALDLDPDWILSSPCTRARETAAIVARALGAGDRLQLCDALRADVGAAAAAEALVRLRPRPARLLLVGHEPQLSSLASLLLSGGPDLDLVLKKAGLAGLTIERLAAGKCAALEWWLAPRQLVRLR
jgi:phosphohistidine phosphatase